MKGLAILMVVAGHYLFIPYLREAIWSFHMPLFVFLNGWFYKQGPFPARVRKSAKAYLKPYAIVWAILVAAACVCALVSDPASLGTAFKGRIASGVYALASDLTLHRPESITKIGAIWFLIALFWANVFMNLVFRIRRFWLQALAVVAVLLTAMMLTARFCIPLGLHYGAAFLPWIWLGARYSGAKDRGSRIVAFLESPGGFIACLLGWIGIVVLEGWTGNSFNICWLRYPLCVLELAGAFFGIVCIQAVSKWLEKALPRISGALRYLGCATLWILCVHAIDIELLGKLFPDSLWGQALRGCFDIAVALVLRLAFKRLSQKKAFADQV